MDPAGRLATRRAMRRALARAGLDREFAIGGHHLSDLLDCSGPDRRGEHPIPIQSIRPMGCSEQALSMESVEELNSGLLPFHFISREADGAHAFCRQGHIAPQKSVAVGLELGRWIGTTVKVRRMPVCAGT